MWTNAIKHAAWLVKCDDDTPADVVKVRCEAANTIKKQWDEIKSLERLLRQCKMLAMKDDGEDSTVREMHEVPLEDIPDFINSRIADLECEAASAESLQAERDMLERTSTHWWREWHHASGRPRPTATDAGVNEACKLMDKRDKEIESLQAVVGEWPKTADGVHVVPGMDLWCWVPAHLGQAKPYILQSSVDIENGPCVPWTDCYSTEAAARAAKDANAGPTT